MTGCPFKLYGLVCVEVIGYRDKIARPEPKEPLRKDHNITSVVSMLSHPHRLLLLPIDFSRIEELAVREVSTAEIPKKLPVGALTPDLLECHNVIVARG
jgi:hypothetical protein